MEAMRPKSESTLPLTLLSCAVTLDGYLDDLAPERLELSSALDRGEVDALRSASDAILVGAGTIRADDPSLTVRSAVRRAARRLAGRAESPIRVVVTSSGNLPMDAQVFSDGAADTIVFGPEPVAERASICDRPGVRWLPSARGSLRNVLRQLAFMGVRRVLVEGGQALSTEMLRLQLAQWVRVSIAPALLGRSRSPRIGGAMRAGVARWQSLRLTDVANLDGSAVLLYAAASEPDPEPFAARSDVEWLAEAIELARRCPPASGAFSVGAIVVDGAGRCIARGYSRELDPHVHAEEAALRKAEALGMKVEGATLYSSMEPCSVRLSGRTPCVERIIRAGVARVVYAQREPPVFVRCQGDSALRNAGIDVRHVPELAPFAAAVSGPQGTENA
jgi:5-amino-6-(5-phosphoribosylamino)uracil reductase